MITATSNLREYVSADYIDLNGVSLNDFEQAMFGTQPHVVKDRNDTITTFRYPTYDGKYYTFHVYGSVDEAQLQIVRTMGLKERVHIEYKTTIHGVCYKYFGTNGDWGYLS